MSAVQTTWQGFTGAPGYTKLWFEDLVDPASRQAAVDAVRAFWAAQAAYFQQQMSLQVEQLVQTYDVGTHKLVSEAQAGTKPAVLQGSALNTQGYFGGVGYVIKWNCNAIINGRHLSGRTFVVPAVAVQESNGTIAGTVITAVSSAAAALIANANAHLVVWHKSFDHSTTPPTPIGGDIARVVNAVVPDRTAVMRSRRT